MKGAAYYELSDDMRTSNRWYLSDVLGPSGEFLGRALKVGHPLTVSGKLTCAVYHPGPPLELTQAIDTVYVVNGRVAEILQARASKDVQLLPVQVIESPEPLWAVNALAVPDCVDEQRSEGIKRWTETDERPDRIGDYKGFDVLRIDPSKVEGRHLFRPRGWQIVTLVSSALAKDLRRAKVRCQLHPLK